MIVLWNSTYIAVAIAHLRAAEQSVPHAWLAETSPLSWEHISFSGDFLGERAAATADKRRPLKLSATIARFCSAPSPTPVQNTVVCTSAYQPA